MQARQIVFTGVKKAELLAETLPPVGPGDVLTKTEYSVISAGTERANIMAMNNTCGTAEERPKFPRKLGYCAIGHVQQVGENVKTVQPGDRVLVTWGTHSDYTVMPEDKIIKVEDAGLDSLDAVYMFIAQMSLGGVRKSHLEIGESALVMGLGLFAVQLCRAGGAIPVIAADPNPARRQLALDLGADYALDPVSPDFSRQVKALTNQQKGVNVTIEVSGNAQALSQALNCSARMARVVLLGCTRVSDCPIDFYKQVHAPGIQIIGAHTHMRPKVESAPYLWTDRDDTVALLRLLSAGRIAVKPIIHEIHSPNEAPEVYRRLCDEKDFPTGVVFDWKQLQA